MPKAKMTEREFLISLALKNYNQQFGKDFRVEDCDIKSLDTRVNYDLSYEVWTNRVDDFLRMRMHLLLSHGDGLGKYRLETDGTQDVGGLTDEVFVALGRVDRYYKDAGIYKFHPILPDNALLPYILGEDYDPILDEAGEPLFTENGT